MVVLRPSLSSCCVQLCPLLGLFSAITVKPSSPMLFIIRIYLFIVTKGNGWFSERAFEIVVVGLLVLSGRSSYNPMPFFSAARSLPTPLVTSSKVLRAFSTLFKSASTWGNNRSSRLLFSLLLQFESPVVFKVPSSLRASARIVRKSVSLALLSCVASFIADEMRVFNPGISFMASSLRPYHARIKSMSNTPDWGSMFFWKSSKSPLPAVLNSVAVPCDNKSFVLSVKRLVKAWVTW